MILLIVFLSVLVPLNLALFVYATRPMKSVSMHPLSSYLGVIVFGAVSSINFFRTQPSVFIVCVIATIFAVLYLSRFKLVILNGQLTIHPGYFRLYQKERGLTFDVAKIKTIEIDGSARKDWSFGDKEGDSYSRIVLNYDSIEYKLNIPSVCEFLVISRLKEINPLVMVMNNDMPAFRVRMIAANVFFLALLDGGLLWLMFIIEVI